MTGCQEETVLHTTTTSLITPPSIPSLPLNRFNKSSSFTTAQSSRHTISRDMMSLPIIIQVTPFTHPQISSDSIPTQPITPLSRNDSPLVRPFDTVDAFSFDTRCTDSSSFCFSQLQLPVFPCRSLLPLLIYQLFCRALPCPNRESS